MIPKQFGETIDYIRSQTDFIPEVGIILGTGLGALADEIKLSIELPYHKIPHFPVSTVESHSGRLMFGELGGRNVVAMKGRFHYYEGYTMQQVTYPVRIMKLMGVKYLFISNASGGLRDDQEISDLMILSDHINLFPESPFRGEYISEFGPRFPDMSEPYDKGLIENALKIAGQNNIKVSTGVYAAVQGPALETPAEYEYMRRIGADAVGMSTIPEALVARQMDIPCFAISVITDLGVKDKIKKVTVAEVIKAAGIAEPKMTRIMMELIKTL